MVASSDPGWLQGDFITLVGLFGRVGSKKNFGKTAGMVCRPYQAEDIQSEAAYKRQITGAGQSCRESQIVRVQCSECG